MWQIWLILAGLFFIIEIATVGFMVFWFGVGALLAMAVSFFTSNIYIQTAVFVCSSTLLLFFTRKLANRFAKDPARQTNAYSIIGKKGIVIKEIDPLQGTGQIKVGTEVWSAKSIDDQKIEKGSEVDVIEIDGVKAIVK